VMNQTHSTGQGRGGSSIAASVFKFLWNPILVWMYFFALLSDMCYMFPCSLAFATDRWGLFPYTWRLARYRLTLLKLSESYLFLSAVVN
jgi:hypothetical protein